MDFISTLLIAIALAMDAFSVSLTKGFTLKKITKSQVLWFAIFFGGFQALMPVLGWLGGIQLEWLITTFAPWIAFILLLLIGSNMIRESFSTDEEEDSSDKFSFKELTLLAIATSIDAFAVGITYAVLKIDIACNSYKHRCICSWNNLCSIENRHLDSNNHDWSYCIHFHNNWPLFR